MNTSVNTRKNFSKTDFDAFVADLLGAGITVIAPVQCREKAPGRVEYRPVHSPEEIVLSGAQPSRPLKEVVFPPTESLFRWKQAKSSIEIEEVPTAFKETVVLGARPCDAAALEIVDKVMGWDYRDELWFGRRESTTILSLACSRGDDSCFCASLGLSPTSTRGADCFLAPVDNGFEIEILTPKGEKLLERCRNRLQETDGASKPQASEMEGRVRANLNVRPEKIREWLEGHFDDPLWKDMALRCHGCGACAFVCPTCHCFDIVDEPEGIDRGERRRNWDVCQTALFTLHGSGHNPRKDQSARFRQRIMHKFNIYPARFGEVLCTGCGRCIRTCAAGMDLIAILTEINRMAGKEGA